MGRANERKIAMETAAIASAASSSALSGSPTAQAMTGEDFFKLLIAQLSNQDPMEPMSNQELLEQISSIRDIELSTALTESLQRLTDQERYGSAAALIGRYVTGEVDPDDPTTARAEGVVVGVRFSGDGQPFLQLDTGLELPLDQVATVVSTEQAAQVLIGRLVTGVDTSDVDAPAVIEGVVTGVRTDPDGTVMLELDTGETLPQSAVVSAVEPNSLADDTRSSA
jgi:flagellar basal-body rod modification protein FlgD